jgi:hypothetical protein
VIDILEGLSMRSRDVVICGAASGVDSQVIGHARARGIHCAEMYAIWDFYRDPAGPIRNRAMMTLQPTHGIVFDRGTPGSMDMLSLLEKANVPVLRVTPEWRAPLEPPLIFA